MWKQDKQTNKKTPQSIKEPLKNNHPSEIFNYVKDSPKYYEGNQNINSLKTEILYVLFLIVSGRPIAVPGTAWMTLILKRLSDQIMSIN